MHEFQHLPTLAVDGEITLREKISIQLENNLNEYVYGNDPIADDLAVLVMQSGRTKGYVLAKLQEMRQKVLDRAARM